MTIRVRERKRLAFAAMIKERGLTRAQIAVILHSSIDTVNSWLKPETSASSNPVPEWAPELLAFKVPMVSLDVAVRGAKRAAKRAAAR
jgi:hypothetical protein